MLVLLNGGRRLPPGSGCIRVPLADACVTEWRVKDRMGWQYSDLCATR